MLLKTRPRKNIKKANVHFLLRSLAAFYPLCIIFDDRWTPLQNSIYGTKIPYTFTYNSNIFSANVYDRQLDFAQQSIMWLAAYNKMNNILDYQSTEEMLRQCEKNLNIKFHEQNPKECLFMAELTPEYLKNLDAFKAKYNKNNKAAETELSLLFSNLADEKSFEKLGIDSLDVLMDHIKLNLEKNIANIVVNRFDGKDVTS